jgi:formamidopyrimidine-DNA glycosylase
MPELPEVETTMNGIRPYLEGRQINELIVRERRLRWLIPDGLEGSVRRRKVSKIERRGKYILIHLSRGGLIIHLGMSGSMRVLIRPERPGRHDHFDIVNESGEIIRFRDPRKFGCLLFSSSNLYNHPRLQCLGVEPLTSEFHGTLLYNLSRKRNIPVKTFIMDGSIVVGVGNIYASESLFDSGIHPRRKCSRISLRRYTQLSASIRSILKNAIDKGGTTLQDFVGVEGNPGYFEQELTVYGRENQLCVKCRSTIRRMMIAQRSTFYCPQCQT